MNTATIITIVICGALVLSFGIAVFASLVLNKDYKAKEAAYWKGFADAVKLEKKEEQKEERGAEE